MDLKKLVLLLWVVGSVVWAGTTNAIAVVVEGEPITTHEISTLQKRAHISKQQAIDLLIQDRLQKTAMKHIVVSDAEVEQEIAKIASLNHLDVNKMKKIIEAQGTPWKQYKKSIRTMIKQRRFFQQELAQTLPEPTEAELKQLYDKEKKRFVMPSTIVTTEYRANTKEALEALRKKKTYNGVTHKKRVFKTKNLNRAMLDTLMQVPKGGFTEPLNTGNQWVMYRVWAKEGRRTMSFDEAHDAVASVWRREQQELVLKDYFQKRKTEADIRYLRK